MEDEAGCNKNTIMNKWVNAPQFSIQPSGTNQLPELLSIYHQCEDFLRLGPEPTATLAMVQQDIEASKREGGIYCAILLQNGQIAGVLAYLPSGYEGNSRAAFITLLMIVKPYRNLGLGRAVIKWVENDLNKNSQALSVWTAVQVNNPQALTFFQHLGYQQMSGPHPQPDGTTAVLLSKNIGNAG
jgi:ribosomal protein S18 acetylase RimI-like enzyme